MNTLIAVDSPTPPVVAAQAADPVIGNIEQFLRDLVSRMESVRPSALIRERGRPRVLPALALWAGLLVCVLERWTHQAGLWRLLSDGHLWSYPAFPVTDQAVYHRLERDGIAPLHQLWEQVTQALRERLAPYADLTLASFATEVMALDQVKLDQVARWLPALRGVPAGDDRLLPGAMGALFDLRRQQWHALEYHTDVHQNEKVAARGLVEALPAGSLLLADLGYFGFAWFDWLTDHQYGWVSRLRQKTSFTLIHTFYHQGEVLDAVVFLGAHRADRMAHAVRLVQFAVSGTTFRYVTNVLEPSRLPIREIARLYARRWDIELAFNLIKTHLGLHLLWSAKTVVLQQQVWAVLIISQILQALRLEIAGRAGVDPFEVSMSLLVQYAPRYARQGRDPVVAFVTAGRRLGFIRPSSRTQIQAPTISPDQLTPMPEQVVLQRTPRYAGRKPGSQTVQSH